MNHHRKASPPFKAFRGESARRRWALGGDRNLPEGEFSKRTLVLLGESLPTFCSSPPAVGHLFADCRNLQPYPACFVLTGILFFHKAKYLLASRVKFLIQTFFKKFGARPA